MTVAEIYKYFREHSIKEVRLEYCGSGDSGGLEEFELHMMNGTLYANPPGHNDLIGVLEKIVYEKSGADFNNEGSQGTAYFTFDEETHKINMVINHQDNIVTTEDTDYDEELVDPDEYV